MAKPGKPGKEELLRSQTFILTGVACILCAALIVYQVIEVNTRLAAEKTDHPTISSVSSEIESETEVSVPVKININTATAKELEELPGIGPVKAQAIVEFREKQGKFTDFRQLLDVKGIGEKTYQKIRDLITLE